jgi:hypothetical protein
LFYFLLKQESFVVYGQEAQGKTQFLFFIFKLLQAMGERVIFLYQTVVPSEENVDKIDIDNPQF